MVLSDNQSSYRIWHPDTNTFTTPQPIPFNHFCSGNVILPDGSVFFTGGGTSGDPGVDEATDIYNPFTDTWTNLPNLGIDRWYATTTVLANGNVLVSSGVSKPYGAVVQPNPQIWNAPAGAWDYLSPPYLRQQFYPRDFVAPNGMVFQIGMLSGSSESSYYFDTWGQGNWIRVANTNEASRYYGSAVMYDDGKILLAGGVTPTAPATASAEVIDLNQPTPTWRSVAPMAYARADLNMTLLPDGTVLVTGGALGAEKPWNPVLPAEIWNPATEQFTTVASMSAPRWYHSTATLLPDGSVLAAGGNGYPSGQIYYPDYLSRGPRPTISDAPSSVDLGQTFFLSTPDSTDITHVNMISLGATTHHFNMGQRISHLSFTQTDGGLNITIPSSADLAIPGYYMLFILNSQGVPSMAKMIQVIQPPSVANSFQVSTLSSPGVNSPQDITITALDGSGNIATGYVGTVHFTSSDGHAILPGDYTFAPGDNGVHTISGGVTFHTTGNQTITATDTRVLAITGSTSVQVTAGVVSRFVVRALTGGARTAGTTANYSVVAQDSSGNTVINYQGTIAFTSSDQQAGLPASYSFTPADGGTHTFAVILKTAGTQSITVTDTMNNSLSGALGVQVSAAAAARIVLSGYPATTAGAAQPFTVTAQDNFGNVATSYTGTVGFHSSDPQAVLPASYTFQKADRGIHTFSAILETAGTQSLTVTDPSKRWNSTETGIVVSPAAAVVYNLSFPSLSPAGTPQTLTLTVRDSYGNVATGYTGTVSFSSSDPAASLPTNYTFSGSDAGVHLFSATLWTPGIQSIIAVDTLMSSLTATVNNIEVV
jgi:hypothetical protein